MNILGISCYYHDAAAALLQDGQLIAAAEEERFSRIKHDFNWPKLAIQFCLDSGGIKAGDLDYVVFYEKPFRKFDRILMSVLQTYPQSYKVFRESMITLDDRQAMGQLEDFGGAGHSAGEDFVRRAPHVARRERLPLLAV